MVDVWLPVILAALILGTAILLSGSDTIPDALMLVIEVVAILGLATVGWMLVSAFRAQEAAPSVGPPSRYSRMGSNARWSLSTSRPCNAPICTSRSSSSNAPMWIRNALG